MTGRPVSILVATGGAIEGGQSFDGSTTTIVVADAPTLDPGLDATVSAWVRLNATGGADLVEKGGTGGYALWLVGNVVWFGGQYSPVSGWAVGTTPLSVGVWYAIDGVNDNGTKSIYVNGVLDASSTTTSSFSNTGSLQLGNGIDGYLNGVLDEVRVESTARSAGWIRTKYNNVSSPGTFAGLGSEQAYTGASATLAATDEDTTSSPTTVDGILTTAGWSDVDTGSSKGVAVTSKAGNGSWQYSTDGVTWNGFGSVSLGNALLLTSTSRVRYIPDLANAETATFGFRAWDLTTDTASTNSTPGYGNPGAGGGTTAYSSQSGTASLTVIAMNDAPSLGNGTSASVAEDTVSPAGQMVSTIFAGQFADVDAGSSFGGIAVVGNAANAGTQGVWQYSTDAGGNWFAIGGVADGATALALESGSLIRFVPVPNYNGSPPAPGGAWS